MSKVIMVTGGSRSGKSVIAEQKAKEYGKRSVLLPCRQRFRLMMT